MVGVGMAISIVSLYVFSVLLAIFSLIVIVYKDRQKGILKDNLKNITINEILFTLLLLLTPLANLTLIAISYKTIKYEL